MLKINKKLFNYFKSKNMIYKDLFKIFHLNHIFNSKKIQILIISFIIMEIKVIFLVFRIRETIRDFKINNLIRSKLIKKEGINMLIWNKIWISRQIYNWILKVGIVIMIIPKLLVIITISLNKNQTEILTKEKRKPSKKMSYNYME